MIIRFENLDNPSYSAQFTFDNNGFKCAEYDFSDFIDVVNPDLSTENSYTDFLIKTNFDFFTDDFVSDIYGAVIPWHSFKVRYSDGSYDYYEGFNTWIQNNFDSNECSCKAFYDFIDGESNCPDNVYQNFVDDSWTSSFCMKRTDYTEGANYHEVRWYNFLDFSNIDNSRFCGFLGLFPTISFVQPDLNYPRFKIFAYDFDNFTNEDCKYSLFLHILDHNSDNRVVAKTLKVGSFGVYQGYFYFENFYGNKVWVFDERYFDFYTFYNTNTIDNVTDYMKSNYIDFNDVNINSFGKPFVFEFKKEDYSGVYMSAIDCECLTNAIDSLNTRIDNFSKSFSEAFNKVPIGGEYTFGSGSVFKSNDLDNIDFYNKFVSLLSNDCDEGIGLQFRKAFLSGNDCSKSVFRTLLNIDYADSFSSAFNLLSGNGSVLTNNAINPSNYRSIYDDFHDSFYNDDCGSWFLESFNEAFNLTNCQGSVFKANDDNWNEEDTIAGIWYKQLDRSYLVDNNLNNSAFWTGETQNNIYRVFSIPYLISKAFFAGYLNNGITSSTFNLTSYGGGHKFAYLFRDAFFDYHSKTGNSDYPNNFESVFLIKKHSADTFTNKILYNGCDGNNPIGIKFCEDVPLNLPTPEVAVTNNVPVPSVDVNNDITVTPSTLDFSWDGFINGFSNPFFDLFKNNQDSFLNVLKNAIFCQFNNEGVKRYNWENSVFKKLLYPENSEDCSDKVGLSELDLFVAPDNIYINSDGKPTRYTSDEVFK